MSIVSMHESSSDTFVYEESQELSVGENLTWSSRILSAFPAFESKNYRLYFVGQLVSLIGSWLQIVAEGWLVLTLTNSTFLIGVVAALAMLPSLLFSLFGGVIIDKFPKKNILLFTQWAAMILALVYGLLTVFHFITLSEIMILAFLLGVVNAIDIPARQAFVVDMVGKERIASAIALNSGVFNGARVVGPSLAGLLIALVGSGGAFLLNGFSYVAAIVALLLMQVETTPSIVHTNPFIAIKHGLTYAFSHPTMRTFLLFTGLVSIFGWSYTTLMPYIAKHVFGQGAAGLGYLYAATGLGSLCATIVLSAYSKKISSTVFIYGGSLLFCLSLFVFTLISNILLAYVFLFLAGVGLIAQFATINTSIQHMVDDSLRGRIMSLYSLMFLGLAPLGNFEIGLVADHIGSQAAIQIGIGIVALATCYLYFSRHTMRQKQEAYEQAQS